MQAMRGPGPGSEIYRHDRNLEPSPGLVSGQGANGQRGDFGRTHSMPI